MAVMTSRRPPRNKPSSQSWAPTGPAPDTQPASTRPPRRISHAGGVFGRLHHELVGEPVDLSDLNPERYPEKLLHRAREAWQERVRTEFRSIQIMNRFVAEVVGAGDPIEVYSAAADMVLGEVRHTALCAAVCEALGVDPLLPEDPVLHDPDDFLAAPMPERALSTAISMVAISETLSVALVEDLRGRCDNPAIKRVLDRICADEERHQDFGWSYVAQSLARFPISTLGEWKLLVTATLAPHRRMADPTLVEIPPEERMLEAHPEPELAAVGLFSRRRQALVFQQCWEAQLKPRLAQLGLL